MKLFAFLSTRKKGNLVPIQIDLEGGVTVEPVALVEKSTQTNTTGACTIKCIIANVSFFLIWVVLSTAFVRWLVPPFTDNTNPNRTIYLNKTDAGYGLALHGWNAISELSPGSAAELDGQIKMGEQLLVINGVSLRRTRFRNRTIQALLETRHEGVELVVAPMHEDPFWISIALGCGNTLFSFAVALLLINVIVSACALWNRWRKRGTVTRTVTLTKSDDGYGFMMIGGKITEVIPGGPADSRNGLKKGDVVVSLNNVAVDGLWDWRIRQIFNARDNDMTLVVRRKADLLLPSSE